MEQKDKELLLKDLCGRLPYGVKCGNSLNQRIGVLTQISSTEIITIDIPNYDECFSVDVMRIKPYLRPMVDMTEEEFQAVCDIDKKRWIFSSRHLTWHIDGEVIDYFNSRMLDWRHLISQGLALEATEDMYNLK